MISNSRTHINVRTVGTPHLVRMPSFVSCGWVCWQVGPWVSVLAALLLAHPFFFCLPFCMHCACLLTAKVQAEEREGMAISLSWKAPVSVHQFQSFISMSKLTCICRAITGKGRWHSLWPQAILFLRWLSHSLCPFSAYRFYVMTEACAVVNDRGQMI